MSFPPTLEALLQAKYTYSHWEVCTACGLGVEIYLTPGKRTIAIDPTFSNSSPVRRHYETCNPTKETQNVGVQNRIDGLEGRDSDNGNGSSAENRHVTDVQRVEASGEGLIHDSGRDDPSAGIKLHGVTDPNHNLIAAGWEDGILVVQFSSSKGYHSGVPEDLFVKIERSRYALRQYKLTVQGKFPYTRLE